MRGEGKSKKIGRDREGNGRRKGMGKMSRKEYNAGVGRMKSRWLSDGVFVRNGLLRFQFVSVFLRAPSRF